jgi:HK97 family phage portal protein
MENRTIYGNINFLLQHQPNPIMSTYDFLYKIFSNLFTENNAFVFIKKDERGNILGFYPIMALNYDLLQDTTGSIYLQFQFINGQIYTLPYEELIHLRKFYNKHDIYGDANKVLKTDLETVHTASEGIKNAIQTTSFLRGILKYTNTMLKDKDIKRNKEQFVQDFLNIENESGIAALDGKAEFQEINLKPITLDKDQLERVNYNIFEYFGVNEKIINNSYNSEEWNAFFEDVIEPIAIQLSQAFTNKIFSIESIKAGHRIVFTTNRIQYASLSQKIELLKIASDRGMITIDEGREILDMSPIGGEEGSKIMQSLNYIDSSQASQYQGGNKNE